MRGAVPFEFGILHFVGIGGIGMSGIAEVMLNLGYQVQGSDISENANVKRLSAKGAKIMLGQRADNVTGAAAIVVSTAIAADNPEVVAAREAGIPVVRRAEMLAELMRLKWSVAVAGTHGKTTTTSLVAALLDSAGFDPTVINGGIISAYDSNAKLGAGDWMVVEADESDGSFLKLRGAVAVVTNIDAEHMEHYGTLDNLHNAFHQFVEAIPFYGFAVLCVDDPDVQALVARVSDRKLFSYGSSPQADAHIGEVTSKDGGSQFDMTFAVSEKQQAAVWKNLFLPMAGNHNVSNAAAAIVVARELGANETQVRDALAEFAGVKRRFTKVGSWNDALIIDDYGHHPVEISAVLQAARSTVSGRVIAIVQPHRYSRLHNLMEGFCTCFNNADTVLVTPVYEAGETPIKGADQQGLIEGLKANGHRDVRGVTRQNIAADIHKIAKPGDLILFLGAGDITAWAYDLPGQLEALDGTG
ncbi:UDP-N-acetylmuramate--L-alanine ligase [hydrothermal vent metagenome]|uniref:UDP-N-acetylmuramate--L-alanine ligase n=1 Tax=hydrothermal vent metagenome TaxID=652676 RepID=A0A3B0RUN1_9ZZZZ